jgi:hypothetical protein
VGAAFACIPLFFKRGSRDNGGGLVIDYNQKKAADNSDHKMEAFLFSDFRIPTSAFWSDYIFH